MVIIIRKICTLLRIVYFSICSIKCTRNARFWNSKETVYKAIKMKKSIIRLGDGEVNILNGRGVTYQETDAKLSIELNELIEHYISNQKVCEYILCMPGEFLIPSINNLTPSQIKSWSFARYYFKIHFDRPVVYGDSFLFAKINEPIYSKLWVNSGIREVIFVHNNYKYAELFTKQYNIHVKYVNVPDKNAFSIISEIENNIKAQISDKSFSIILLSIGPCTKLLAYRLSSNGYWCIDTGHCWDDPLKLRNNGEAK